MQRGYEIGWTVVAGARIDKEVRERFKELREKYARQFRVQEVSREQFRLALTVAKNLERQRKRREKEERARVRAERKAREEKARQERAKAERERKAREERERVQREAAERVAREFAEKYRALLSRDREPSQGDSARVRDETDAAEKLQQHERDQADEKARQKQREAADRLALEARRARELADNRQPGEMTREVADILHVTRPTPGIELPHREPPQAGRTRGGREERSRERGGRERTRD